MGKRSKSGPKPATKRKQDKMPTVFQCLFCNHDDAVVVKLEKKLGVGQLNCKVCGQTFQTGINCKFSVSDHSFPARQPYNLSVPADIYYDWVDACEAIAKQHTSAGGDPDSVPAPRDSGTVRLAGKLGGSRFGRPSAAALPGTSRSGYAETGAGSADFVVEDGEDAEGDFGGDLIEDE